MDLTVTPASLMAYCLAMLLLAAMPSLSVVTVTARAATAGLLQGVWVSAGVVVGDLIFIAVALIGLGVLAVKMGPLFALVQLAGGVYLLWMAWRLMQSHASPAAHLHPRAQPGPTGSFMSGLLLTLADQKAVLFYLGFFPAFFTVDALGTVDIVVICLLTVLAVGGIKVGYAAIAARGGAAMATHHSRWLQRLAAVLLGAVAITLLYRALVSVAA